MSRLYALTPYNMFASGFAALALGVARSLLDAVIDLAKEKTPRGFKHLAPRRRRDPARGRSVPEARLRAARSYLMGTVAEAWDEAQRPRTMLPPETPRWRSGSPRPMPIRQAKDVADTRITTPPAPPPSSPPAPSSAASSAIIHAVARAASGPAGRTYRTVGQHLLGVECGAGLGLRPAGRQRG